MEQARYAWKLFMREKTFDLRTEFFIDNTFQEKRFAEIIKLLNTNHRDQLFS